MFVLRAGNKRDQRLRSRRLRPRGLASGLGLAVSFDGARPMPRQPRGQARRQIMRALPPSPR